MKRWKSEMLQITWKIRGWMEEMLQIACETEGLGHHLGTHTMGGGHRHVTRQQIFIYYIYIYTNIQKKNNDANTNSQVSN